MTYDITRRVTTNKLAELARLIERMEQLGSDAEDAAARVSDSIGSALGNAPLDKQRALLDALADVIEIVTERSTLAHQAHRVILDLRDVEAQRRRVTDGLPLGHDDLLGT
jgi:hypothetical protein